MSSLAEFFNARFRIAVVARYYARTQGGSIRSAYRIIANMHRHDAMQPFATVEAFEDFQCRHLEKIKAAVEDMIAQNGTEPGEDIRPDGLKKVRSLQHHERRQEEHDTKEFICRCLDLCEQQVKKSPLNEKAIRRRFSNAIYNACRSYRAGHRAEQKKKRRHIEKLLSAS